MDNRENNNTSDSYEKKKSLELLKEDPSNHQYVENRAQIDGSNEEGNSSPMGHKGNGYLGWSALLLFFVLVMSGRMLYLTVLRENISIIDIVGAVLILLLLVALLIKAVFLNDTI